MSQAMLPLYEKTIYFSYGLQAYMHEEIKKTVMEAIEILFDSKAPKFRRFKAVKKLWDVFESLKGLPEPTIDRTWHPNTRNLIELRDWFFDRCSLNTLRMGFIRRVMNFVIILYDFDPPWRWILDSVREKSLTKDWKPRGFEDTWSKTYTWWNESKN